ncbi:MAG: hypothetical protein U0S48_17480 [Solirubrobacteraceae bacterium]
MSRPPTTLQPALAALPADHRSAVAEAVGAPGTSPAEILAVLGDEARLAQIVGDLPNDARAAVTEIAFAKVDLWTPPNPPPPQGATLAELERHGLALCLETSWSLAYAAPSDLVAPLRRIRIRAHAARIPDAPPPARMLASSDQLVQDVAAVGATLAHGGIQLKADGDIYARSRPKLVAALSTPADPIFDIGETRLDLALRLLQELDALHVVGDDLPGRNARRELRLCVDLPALLDQPAEARSRLARPLQHLWPQHELIEPLLDELAGRTVELSALGDAIVTLFAEARKHLPVHDAQPASLALAATHLRWLCGGARLGVDSEEMLATITFGTFGETADTGPPCVAQGDFDLVALRAPLPHERAGLLLLCEPVDGREHVFRLTRERIQSAVRALCEPQPEALVARLRTLAGDLPQNVERSVAAWVDQTPPQVRLRSAIMLDSGDTALADRVVDALGPAVVERLAPRLLAIDAHELPAVAGDLRKAGIELAPGLDRISGSWQEPAGGGERYSEWWRPSIPRTPDDFPGQLVSGLDGHTEEAGSPLLPDFDTDDPEIPMVDDEDPAPGEIVLASYESGEMIELVYAGADGMVVEQVTVEEIDRARFRVQDAGTGALRWRWAKGLRDARFVER